MSDLVPISALAEVNPRTTLPLDSPVSFVGMEDVSESFAMKSTVEVEPRTKGPGYTRFKENDILFAKITPCMENGKGAVAKNLTNGYALGSTEFHVLRCADADSRAYLAQWLAFPHLRQSAEAFMTGSAGQRRVPASFFDKFLVPNPSSIQKRYIAEVLLTLDEQIRSSSRVIAKLEYIKEASLTYLLKQIGGSLGRFGTVCQSSAFGPRFSSENYGEFGELAMLRTTDLDQEGNIRLHTMPRIALPPASFSSHLLAPKDLLISRSGTCGIASVFPGYEVPVIPGAFLIRFRLHTPDMSAFYRRYFNSSLGRPSLDRLAVGGVQKNLKGSEILQMLVPIPSLTDAAKIEEAMAGIESDIASENKMLEKIRILKQGLQADLLTGRVRVPAEAAS